MPENIKVVPVIGFYGFSNSGKTSVIFKLIRKLKVAGYRSAVIKRTDKAISSEPKDKDTFGFRAAGAKITSFASMSETNFVLGKIIPTRKIVEIILNINEVDLIIVEGAMDKEIKKIRLGNIPLRENTIYDYKNGFENLYKTILKMI
jgi:molybdopterin-guanine dinucleotide biosynthesis adapter protein